MKGSGAATDWQEIDRWDGGFGWLAFPHEPMQRASHVLAGDDEVWVVDPVDVPGLDDRLADAGTVRGVAVLLDRHKRDAAAVAARHDVPVSIPAWMDDVSRELPASVERLDGSLPGTNYRVIRVVNNRFWREAALYDPETATLHVPEAVGTVDYYLTGDHRLGVHPALRLKPPRRVLGAFEPERLTVGHGTGIFDGASDALAAALASSRRTAPRLYAKTLSALVRG